MTTTHPPEPEHDDLLFLDSYDRLLSSTTCSSSSSCSEIEDNINYTNDDVSTGDYYNTLRSLAVPKFPIGLVNNYDVWISSPSSVDERRLRLLRRMGLGRDLASSRRNTSVSGVSGAVEGSYSVIRSKSADHEVRNKQCDVSREIVPIADSSVSNSNDVEEAVLTIRNLDNGKEFVVDEVREDGMCGKVKEVETGRRLTMEEFVVDEVREDGMCGKVKEVETGRRLTMEEFEMCVGRSPIVQELMRRENVEAAACGGNEGLRGEDSGNGNGNGNGSKVKKKTGWFNSIRNVASSVAGFKERRSSDERDTSSERGGRRSSSATDDSQDVAFHGPERVRVRQYGKSCKDLSALFKSQEIHAHNGTIWTIKFSLDGKYLASAGEDRLIHIWQVGSSDRKGDLLFDKQEDVNLNVLLLSSGSPELGLGSPNLDTVPEKKRRGRLSISRKSTSLEHIVVPETIFALSEKPVCTFIGHEADVLDLSWSKSQHLLSSSMDKTVRLWDLSSQSCLKKFSHNDYVTCIQFNPVDDRYFISGSLDAKVRIWSIPDHQVVDWNDMREMVTAACYAPDGQAALVGSYKGSCCLYNTTENKLEEKSRINLQNKKKSRHKKITGFQFAPGTASEVLITSADSRIRVVDGADLVHKFKGFRNTNRQISAALTANGRYVVCASEDSQVYVWKHEGDARPSRKKGITVAHSYEHFHCQDVSVAIPWPGKNDTSCDSQDGFSRESSTPSGDHLDDVLSVNHPPTPEDQVYGKDRFPLGSGCTSSSPFHGIISSASNGYFFDRFSATWPEEKLVSATKKQSRHMSADFTNGSSPNKSAWGMVIVTAGVRGELRTFQNFGLPVRI